MPTEYIRAGSYDLFQVNPRVLVMQVAMAFEWQDEDRIEIVRYVSDIAADCIWTMDFDENYRCLPCKVEIQQRQNCLIVITWETDLDQGCRTVARCSGS